MRRSPHGWKHIEVLRLDLGRPAHPLLLDGPVILPPIRTVLSLGRPVSISPHGIRQSSGWAGAEAPQHLLQARGGARGLGLELCLVLLKVVGPLLLLERGDGAGAGASGALLDGSGSRTWVGRVVGALPVR